MLNHQSKIIHPESNREQIISACKKLAEPLVFTNGCFDILHRGHISYLESARNLGAALVVAVNSDDSVRKQNKGNDRPINNLMDRMSLLASLESVDAVVSFDDETPLDLIQIIKPNHLVKGGDWPVEDIVGATEVIDNGGQVHSITFEHNRSTTQLLERIRKT